MEILYYTNGRGGLAISIDGGEHVVIKTGRRLLLRDTRWEETDDESIPLSPEQEAAVEAALAELAALSEDQKELNDLVVKYRKRRLRHAKTHPTREPEKRHRKLPPSVMVEYASLIDD
jgi:hypothetical protein